MHETIEMVYSACLEWLKDWVSVHPPVLVDEWDLMQWISEEMTEATAVFIEHGFHGARARNDAILILRALFYEYYLFQRENYLSKIRPNKVVVERLPNCVQTQQKSASWHAEAREMLSGHEFGGVCIGTAAERNGIIAKKCMPQIVIAEGMEQVESQTVFLSGDEGLSAFKWGWRYEPVARMLFERCVANGTVYDGLGRVRHPTLPRLGASPDGLIMDGPRCGRLVEIKCPISRELKGSIPIAYYCQMQLQAEVCDVDAVEYIEVKFGAVPQTETTFEDVQHSKQPWIGKVCVIAPSVDALQTSYQYAYSPLFPATRTGLEQCKAWTPDVPTHTACLESSIWYVKDWFTTTVPRNKRWFEHVGKPAYEKFWEDVDAARLDGRFERRALVVDSESDSDHEQNHKENLRAWVGVESETEPTS